ncbi:MAG: DUF6056 family protein [Lachnospiraceae bacterium]|nr:DUF6056 family protein [Lachnospiraceae bacterium]
MKENGIEENVRTSTGMKVFLALGALLLGGIIFYHQRKYFFRLEDLDYLKNMSTGEDLKSISDIFANLSYCFKNSGGSMIGLAVLQLVLLAGEGFANIFNTLLMLSVAVLICLTVTGKRQRFFFTTFALSILIALNDTWELSYFWEFGTVLYFLPAIFMLLFVMYYCRLLDEFREEPSTREGILIFVCGLLAGAFNASYGVICLFTALFSMVLDRLLLHKYIKKRMILGAAGAAAGVIAFMSAPGNYTADSIIKIDFIQAEIFPAVVLLLVVLAILLRTGGWLTISQIMMTAVLGLSVIYCLILRVIPGVSGNGAHVGCIVLSLAAFCGVFYQMNYYEKKNRLYGYALLLIMIMFDIICIFGESSGVI